jgi:hypothetical protein
MVVGFTTICTISVPLKTKTKLALQKESDGQQFYQCQWGCHGRDRMVVGFTTTCAISAYHH